MFVTLDVLAQRYHVLPSEALERATTIDLYVMDVANQYANRKQAMAQGKIPATRKPLSVEQMKAMMTAAKAAPPMKRKGATK